MSDALEQTLFCAALAVVAVAYAAVGQGGDWLHRIMGIVGFAPVIRPTALILNVLVSAIGTVSNVAPVFGTKRSLGKYSSAHEI